MNFPGRSLLDVPSSTRTDPTPASIPESETDPQCDQKKEEMNVKIDVITVNE